MLSILYQAAEAPDSRYDGAQRPSSPKTGMGVLDSADVLVAGRERRVEGGMDRKDGSICF